MRLKNFTKAILLFFLLITQLSCISLRSFEGYWTGIGDQIDGQSWGINIDAQISEGILIDYPSLGCGGSWALIKKTDDKLWFREQLNYGKKLCDQGVEISIEKRNRKTLLVLFYLKGYNNGKPIAKGLVYKQKDRPQRDRSSFIF